MAVQIQIRRDTTANWASENSVLTEGELGLDTTLDKFKIGNGTDAWSILSFQEGSITTVTDNLTSTSTSEALSANQGKVLKTLIDAIPAETTTTLSINANVLTYTDEAGTATTIDLALYLDDTNLARIVSGVLAGNIATFTRDDSTTFTVDFSSLLSGKADTIHGTHLTAQDTTDIATGVAHAASTHAPTDAEANVQSDWDQVTTTADDFIKNKPAVGGSDVVASDTPPANPTAGDLWVDSSTMQLNTYYEDADSSQWVGTSAIVSGGTGGTGGTTNLTVGVIWDNHSTTAYDYTNDGVAGSSDAATDITVVADKTAVLTHTSDTEELRSVYIEKYVEVAEVPEVPAGTTGVRRIVMEVSDAPNMTYRALTGLTFFSAPGVEIPKTGKVENVPWNHPPDQPATCTFDHFIITCNNSFGSEAWRVGGITGDDTGANECWLGNPAVTTSTITVDFIAPYPSLTSIEIKTNGNHSSSNRGAIITGGNFYDENLSTVGNIITAPYAEPPGIVAVVNTGLAVSGGTPAIPAYTYWQLESFDDWGVQFTSPTTTTLVNNTTADAVIRARITKPTSVSTNAYGALALEQADGTTISATAGLPFSTDGVEAIKHTADASNLRSVYIEKFVEIPAIPGSTPETKKIVITGTTSLSYVSFGGLKLYDPSGNLYTFTNPSYGDTLSTFDGVTVTSSSTYDLSGTFAVGYILTGNATAHSGAEADRYWVAAAGITPATVTIEFSTPISITNFDVVTNPDTTSTNRGGDLSIQFLDENLVEQSVVTVSEQSTNATSSNYSANNSSAGIAAYTYWQLETYNDWGVQFTDPETTTITNNTGADATARFRITAPTAAASGGSTGEANVQADWDVTDAALDTYIANKPTVPTTFAPVGAEVNVQSDWNVTDAALDTYIANKPAIEANVQSDWNVTDAALDTYIANKPAMGASTLAGLTDSTTVTTDPLITSNLSVGHFWINSASGEAYVCTDVTTDLNVWTNIGDGTQSILPNVLPTNPTNTPNGQTQLTSFNHTFTGATDPDGTVTHYMVDQLHSSLTVATAEVTAGSAHVFTIGALTATTSLTFRVRSKDDRGEYSSGVTVTFEGGIGPLYSFSSATFTDGGAYAPPNSIADGPTIAQARSGFPVWANSYINMTYSGVRAWTVPTSGNYLIVAKGAKGGGWVSVNGDIAGGGRGAVATATVTLSQSDILNIIVGHSGNSYTSLVQNGGGGGGSFVSKGSNFLTSDILVAAGGGGGHWSSGSVAPISYFDGQVGTSGGGITPGTNGYGGLNGSSSEAGAGGGGWFGPGTGGTGGHGFLGGKQIRSTDMSGAISTYGEASNSGGFGGGAAGWGAGGGGGGYSGGGPITVSGANRSGSGGGGSIITNGATGSIVTGSSGNWAVGSVTISLVG